MNRKPAKAKAFIRHHARAEKVTRTDRVTMLRLLEMQRHCMLMYTSCAWFFNEVTGIETLQVLQYANRALHLCLVVTGKDHHPAFVKSLKDVPSNERENAAAAYREAVMPARVGLRRVGIHFAAASLFEDNMAELELFNYRADIHDLRPLRAGGYGLSLGRITIRKTFSFGVLYLGQQTMIGSIRDDISATAFEHFANDITTEFRVGHVGEVIALLTANFGSETFSIWHLFRDEKRKILLSMTDRTLEIAATNFKAVYYDNYQLMSTMRDNGMPLPDAYQAAINFTLHRRFEDVLTDGEGGLLDQPRLDRLVADFRHWKHKWREADDLRKAAEDHLYRLVGAAFENAENWALVLYLLQAVENLKLVPNYYRAQNTFLAGWTPLYADSLAADHLASGLAVARELRFELGFADQEVFCIPLVYKELYFFSVPKV